MDKSYREIFNPTQPQFWKNLWFYNKKIILAIFVGIIIIVFGVTRCQNITRPDAGILLVTQHGVAEEQRTLLQSRFQQEIDDINGDGKKTVHILEIYISEADAEEVDSANRLRVVNEIINGDSNVIIAEKELVESFFEQAIFFEQPEEGKLPLLKNKEGVPMAVDITETSFADEIGYRGKTPLCLMLKGADESSPLFEMYKQGEKIAKIIINS